MMSGSVALTGATGFIGGTLCRSLVNAGFHVRALTRKPQLPAPGVTWIPGDLETPPALASLVAGTHAVIHCAGAVRGKSPEEFNRVNTAGTRAMVAACLAQSPRPRLLFISTLAARAPDLSWYAASKAAAEELIRAGAGELQWTILRPTAVYGPGDREMRPFFQALLRGVLPSPQPRGSRFSLLHVDDLAGAVMQWLRQSPATNSIFELCDGTENGYDAETLARMVGEHLGRPIRVLNLPAALLRLAAGGNLLLSRVTGRSPMLTPGKVRELTHRDWTADADAYTRATGWSPRIRFMDALAAGRLFFT